MNLRTKYKIIMESGKIFEYNIKRDLEGTYCEERKLINPPQNFDQEQDLVRAVLILRI